MLISDATNNSSTSILPWLSPVFEDYDFISFIQSEGKPSKYEKHEIITSEYESSQKVIFLTSGLLVSLTTYHELSKPFLISNICIPCTICGYARYLVKHQPPLRTTALCNSEAIAVPFKQLDRYFSKNNKAYNSFMTYCGYCMRSEITSMLAMLTLPAEDKFWILMGAIALHFNIDIKKNGSPYLLR
ncbi:hypothetical protein [Seleniivibrio sp.]|uniref:hypothetical protein n=1 Tax=Seleniivibrio sp. TaxID=2898801 RepID=UPI0025E32AE6|nr:hypothetical protein [Seleniivibrio sp.]MCD8554824.1 hypothetical protein [Seleniivibrio sp.]